MEAGRVATLLRLAALCVPVLGNTLQAGSPAAVDDQAETTQDTPVSIAVLANDCAAGGSQMAILHVTAPSHGKVAISSGAAPAPAELASLFQFAAVQLSNTVVEVGDTNRYPRGTSPDGTWRTRTALDWTAGFFPGCLWYLFEHTGDTSFRNWAESWMAGIAPQQYNTNYHDLGFEINNSFGAGYRLTANPEFRAVVLQAAQSLSTRYNGAARCISWVGPVTNGPLAVITDTMMNLELLFHASRLSGDRRYCDMACNHAETTMLNHIRADGSSYSSVTFDGDTGAVLSKSGEDTWARGQAWATYGFIMAYRETGDARFLNTAQRLVDYYLTNVLPDYVPYWNYQAPGIPIEPRDSSAAAITLAGLVELCQLGTNLQGNAHYWQAAQNLFNSLRSTNYLAQGSISSGLLLHGTGEPPTKTTREVDVSLIYGDYYFIEALSRYEKLYRQTSLTYTPDPGFTGSDVFIYQVCDSGGECATATVTVAIEPPPTNVFAAQISLLPATHWPTIVFPSVAGQTYHLECLDALGTAGQWGVLVSNIPGSGSPMAISDTNPPPARFYRVRADVQ